MKFLALANSVALAFATLSLVTSATSFVEHDVESMLKTRSADEVRMEGRAADNYLKFTLDRKLPGLDFKIPQSYAGYLSVNKTNPYDDRQFYFFYTAAEKGASADDIVIWLNGGPGCSSMEGLWQENGPMVWDFYKPDNPSKPYLNPYSTSKIAHAIWIDQPGNTGFSKAGENIQGYAGIAEDMTGFLVNFFSQFKQLKGKKLWITGESFAGAMIPYIAHQIYEHPKFYKNRGINLKGIHINDPSWANNTYMQQLPAFEYAQHYQKTLTINDTELASVRKEAKKYKGLTTFVADNLKYPPKGPIKAPANWNASAFDIWGTLLSFWNGAHCSSVYDITTKCPATEDPLGYPLTAGAPSATNIMNNVTGLKYAMNADNRTFYLCTGNNWVDLGTEPLPQASIMPSIIENSERVIIGGGDRDSLLLTNGSRLAIQNMTWSGYQGFQTKPHGILNSAEGQRGTYHTERGLTLIEYFYAGHMVPQMDRPAGFKTTKYLVGQISKLSTKSNTK